METLVNFDINSYTIEVSTTDTTITITINIVYFGVIETINVNFTGDFRLENFTINYKN